ncbi:MAG: RnfABCDGE type electron transport complex subunit G [Butyrivibrio sp.]
MKKILKDTLALFLITLVAGLLLGIVYKITKDPIEKENEKAKLEAYRSVFAELEKTEAVEDSLIASAQSEIDKEYKAVTLNEAVKAFDTTGNYLGLIITVTDGNGYGGNIKMTVGIDKSGTITGLEFLELSETAGLGMKAKEDTFKSQFAGINADRIEFVKGGKSSDNQIDAISSATITTTAVTDGVNGALTAYRALGGEADE